LPADLTGETGRSLKVNAAEDGYDFADIIYADTTASFTNKTIDSDNNSIENLTLSRFKDSVINTASEALANADNQIPTSARVLYSLEQYSGNRGMQSRYNDSGSAIANGDVMDWPDTRTSLNAYLSGDNKQYSFGDNGIAIVTAHINTDSVTAAAGQFFGITLQKNGTDIINGTIDNAGANAVTRIFSSRLSAVVYCSSSDTLQIRILETIGNTISLSTSEDDSDFSVFFIKM
jgi:hypothetical protein